MPNWSDVLDEVNRSAQRHQRDLAGVFDTVRRRYLKKYFKKTGRNTIAYYSGWLTRSSIAGLEIRDEDKNAFMMAVHNMDRSKGLDLILHTPGGSISAAESIVTYLKSMFGDDIRAVVPQIAMSAGTMLACACKEIVMGKHSNLGPVDPQLNGLPAHGVITEFDTARREIAQDPSKLQVWQFILSKYTPSFLNQCQQAIMLSEQFVARELRANMFREDPRAAEKVQRIVAALTNYASNLTHDKHIHVDECKGMGLKVKDIEDDQEYQDLLLTIHHCYMHTLGNTRAFKIVENQLGVAFIKVVGEQSP
ncbi:SDH family Clp fold serine proteinase [Roseomonas sp. AR75]|uniref:SDH family Clp fold serine proteinase n=1 Tax=Roseomonas sp. AR75 TaxID=2562311 RepID=UPI0010C0D889|nr:ATP-dependent Clp protease proteolytic subunit [Roseomonas sp. AR75]